jgi:hypothetical protein
LRRYRLRGISMALWVEPLKASNAKRRIGNQNVEQSIDVAIKKKKKGSQSR